VRKLILLVSLILAGLLITRGCINTGPYLNMVVQPEGTPTETQDMWEPVVSYLQDYTHEKIVMTVTTDYSTTIVALQTGHADVAKLGPFSYILAAKQAEIDPLVRGVRANTGLAYQTPYIFVRNDSGITSLEQLKGKRFAFVDVDSTSGYLVPMAAFKKLGIVPETFFGQMYFAGSHDLAIEAVKMDKADAGCSNNLVYEQAIKEGAIQERELTIISKGEPIPTDVIVVRKTLAFNIKEKLLNAYLDMPTNLSIEVFGESGYIKTYDKDFDGIREVASILDIK
jgi:phosphonate transport system substrate-binding protein